MIATAPFGRTGHESSRAIFGAAALGSVSQADADRTLELLLEHGVNHIDTAASYGDSELRIAPWMRARARPLLPRDQDRRATATTRPRGEHPPLARAARRRPRRPDPAAQPRRRRSSGRRRCGTAARSRRRSRRATRASCASSASPATASRSPRCTGAASSASPSTRCCCPTTSASCGIRLYAEHFEALARDVRRARRRGADDQEHRARAVGRAAADRLHLVRAAHRPGRHRARGALGARRGRRSSSTPPATSSLLPHVLAAAERIDRGAPSADERRGARGAPLAHAAVRLAALLDAPREVHHVLVRLSGFGVVRRRVGGSPLDRLVAGEARTRARPRRPSAPAAAAGGRAPAPRAGPPRSSTSSPCSDGVSTAAPSRASAAMTAPIVSAGISRLTRTIGSQTTVPRPLERLHDDERRELAEVGGRARRPASRRRAVRDAVHAAASSSRRSR